MAKAAERVLIYRLGSLGDTVAALPSLHLVARAFPQAERRMLTNFPVHAKAAAAAAVLDGSGLVQGYFEYPAKSRNIFKLLALWWRLFRFRPQVVVYLAAARGVQAARRDLRFFRLLGRPRLIGFPLTEDLQRNRPVSGMVERECERLARTLAELGDAALDEPAGWDLRLSPAERARAAEVLAPAAGRPLILFSVGTKRQPNDWGQERWRALMAALGQRYEDHALAFTGVAAESDVSEFAAQGWREAVGPGAVVLNLCGILTPRESAACFAQAKLFLGADSGPMHLAASVGTTVVAIFSARNLPGKWFPYGTRHRVLYHRVDCMGCMLEECVAEGKKCIYSISTGEVLAAVAQAMGELPAAPSPARVSGSLGSTYAD